MYPLLNFAQCHSAAWMGGESGGKMDTCVYVWLSCSAIHLKL